MIRETVLIKRVDKLLIFDVVAWMHNDIAVISESDTRLGEQLAFNKGNKVGLLIK